jgi:8-oxo-dGTP pyrophosphatase MutT (NUDIX family)
MSSADRPPTIAIVAAVVVDAQGRALVVRKRGTTAFMQPGGKIDPGESAPDAVIRELGEELGVTVTASEVTALGRYVADAANEPGHVVDAELFTVSLRDEPRAAAEIEELRWLDPAAPPDVDLAPLTRDVVFALLRQGRSSSSS